MSAEPAQLENHRRFVSARAWHFSKRGLPPSLEFEDLTQIGMMVVAEYYEKNPEAPAAYAQAYFGSRVDGAMMEEINRAKFGVRSGKSEFSTVPFSHLGRDEDDRDFLEASGLEAFGFSSAPIAVPTDPDVRLRIFTECSEKLRKEFGSGHSIETVPRVRWNGASFGFQLSILGNAFERAGYATKRECAEAKRWVYTQLRDMVLPIDPAKPQRGLSERKTIRKAMRLLDSLPVHGRALPAFLHGDPLRVLLVLEKMYASGTLDWTEFADA